jgi:hypothetical protein
MNYTYDNVMNADNVEEAVFMAERAMPGHEDQIAAMLKHHWGVTLCTCCGDGFHEIRAMV